MSYKKCPRCELNYIKEVEEVLCKVCLSEVGKAIRANDEDEEDYEICSECGENIIKASEEMCYQCMMERMKEETGEQSDEKGQWEDFIPKDEEVIFEDEDDDDEDDGLGDLEEIDLDDESDEDYSDIEDEI